MPNQVSGNTSDTADLNAGCGEVKLVNGFIIVWHDLAESIHNTPRPNHLMPMYRISKLNPCQVSQSLAAALSLLKFHFVTGSPSRLAG